MRESVNCEAKKTYNSSCPDLKMSMSEVYMLAILTDVAMSAWAVRLLTAPPLISSLAQSGQLAYPLFGLSVAPYGISTLSLGWSFARIHPWQTP